MLYTFRHLPPGVQTLNPALNTKDDDTLFSVNQRFAYTDQNTAKKRNVHISKYKTNKMTVRLRPRQVLCSKCKGICNENSENVTRKRKISESVQNPPVKRNANAPVTRSTCKTVADDKESSKVACNKVNSTNDETNEEPDDDSTHSLDHSDPNDKKKRPQRKKRNTESTEDETTPEELKNNNSNVQNNANSTENPLTASCTNTRTIKISYGPQGEGTVLKIPAQIENLNVSDDSEENLNLEKARDENNKAARKAMKKAKKEAKKKVLSSSSPTFSVGASSPRYTVGSASPRHGLGNASPRCIVKAFDANLPRKRKHKMKHKKKHKEDRKHRDGEVM